MKLIPIRFVHLNLLISCRNLKPWVRDQGKGVARLRAKGETRESHHMLPGVQKSVRE
jgi:hypothetical protein